MTEVNLKLYQYYFTKAKSYGFNFTNLGVEVELVEQTNRFDASISYQVHNATCSDRHQKNPCVCEKLPLENVITHTFVKCLTCKVQVQTYSPATRLFSGQPFALEKLMASLKVIVDAFEAMSLIEHKLNKKEKLGFKECYDYFQKYHALYLNRKIKQYTSYYLLHESFKTALKTLQTFFETKLTSEVFEKAAVYSLYNESNFPADFKETNAEILYETNKEKDCIIAQEVYSLDTNRNALKLFTETSASVTNPFSFDEMLTVKAHEFYNEKDAIIFVAPSNVSYIFANVTNEDSYYYTSFVFDVVNTTGVIKPEVTEILLSIYPESMINDNMVNLLGEHNMRYEKNTYGNLKEAYEHAELLTLN